MVPSLEALAVAAAPVEVPETSIDPVRLDTAVDETTDVDPVTATDPVCRESAAAADRIVVPVIAKAPACTSLEVPVADSSIEVPTTAKLPKAAVLVAVDVTTSDVPVTEQVAA
jgi:hypothetical protein